MAAPAAPNTTAPNAAYPVRPRPLADAARPWLSVLLPFTALGLLPWWVCAAQALALLLSRVSDDARSIAGALVLLAAVAVSAPLLPDLERGGTLFLEAALLGAGALWAARQLEGGRWSGLLLPVAALLAAPGPLPLAALLLCALGLEGPDARPGLRLGGRGEAGQDRGGRPTQGLLLGALLLGLLTLALPHVSLRPPAPAAGRQAQPPARVPAARQPPTQTPATQTATTQGSGSGSRAPLPFQLTFPEDDGLYRTLWPLAGLLTVVCLFLLVRRMRRAGAERRTRWTDYAAVAGLSGALVMLLALGVAGQRGGAGTGPEQTQPPTQTARQQEQKKQEQQRAALALNVGGVLAVLAFGGLALGLWLLSRREGAAGRLAAAAAPALDPAAPAGTPLHRVRAAYLDAQTRLEAAGLGRLDAEAPETYAARVAAALPALQAPLAALTRLYLPVRYGGGAGDVQVGEAGAQQAERAAAEIGETLFSTTFIPDPTSSAYPPEQP